MTEPHDKPKQHLISELGDIVLDELHLKDILLKLPPDQQKIVFERIRKYLRFPVRDFRAMMRKNG